MKYKIYILLLLTCATGNLLSQDTITSDGLLKAARHAAFEEKNYNTAKHFLQKALILSPGYADVRIFLGRIYSWNKKYDSARTCFEIVLQSQPDYEDASIAYADMAYWNDEYEKVLDICTQGIQFHPTSQELLLRKAKAQNAMRHFTDAATTTQQIISLNRNNTAARALANSIRENTIRNKMSIGYDYTNFDKQFSNPWHLISVDYGRNTSIGSVIARINYANRFAESGYQYELESYPRISNTFYSYVSLGFSDNVGVFPHWRGGFSLYANLPKSYEAEIGFRYLKFNGDPTWIYTAYLGKYYKSWLWSIRSYVTPSTFTKTVSASYNLSAKYYFGTADDMLGANIGYGISPDDRSNVVQLNSNVRLISYKAGVVFRKRITPFQVFSIDAGWFNQEYRPKVKGNQYQFSISWLFRF